MTIAMRHVVKFPARVQATKGVDVTRANGTYTFKLNYENLTPAASVASNANVAFQDPATGEMGVTSLSSALNSNANIQAIANATTAADKIGYWNGTASYVLTDFTAFGRTLVGTADAEAARTSLGVTASADLATVATSGDYADLSGLPTLGDMAAKDKVAVADIDATGTPSATTVLFGNNTWGVPAGGGDMLKSVYESRIYDFDTVTAIGAANVPAAQVALRTGGYYAAGDGGGALYQRVVALGTNMVGFQSADGAWWQLVPVNGILNVKACGAKGTWVYGTSSPFDDAPSLRAAVAMATTAKLTIKVPSGKYYVNSTVSGAVLTVTDSSLRMIGDGRDIVYPSTVEGSVFVPGPNILSTEDFLHLTGSATVRGTVLRGWGITPYGGVHSAAVGRYGIFVEATNNTYHLEYAEFSDLFIDNMGTASIATSAPGSNTGGSLCYSTIRDCQVMQMSLGALGDSVNVVHNVIGFNQSTGSNIGVYFYNIAGAANTRVKHNVIASQLGASVVCDGGTTPLIAENEFELHDFYPNGSGAIINIAGGVSQVLDAMVGKNSISNNHVQNIIWNVVVGNAVGTEIAGGWSAILSTQPAGRAHIAVTASASDTRILPGFFTVDGVSADPIISDNGVNTTIIKMRNKKMSLVGSFDTTSHITSGGVVAGKVYTVSTLPTGLPAGARAFVSDSTVATFTSAPVSGGGNFVPVFWNGFNWLIG
jgi:hypothetical protein